MLVTSTLPVPVPVLGGDAGRDRARTHDPLSEGEISLDQRMRAMTTPLSPPKPNELDIIRSIFPARASRGT
jgi:hypothetical protein